MLSTYMLRFMGALFDIRSRGVGKICIPDELLSAVEVAPVPMCSHYSANEVGVVLVWSIVGNEFTRVDMVSWRSDRGSGCESCEWSEEPHVGVLVRKWRPKYRSESVVN